MSKESLRFLLFDTHSKEKLRFTLVELRAFIKTIPKSRLAVIKVQMEGRAEWLSLANFREAKPPEPEISPDEETTVIELRQNLTRSPRPKVEVKTRAKSSGTNERRRRPRVKIRRRVIIVSNELVFRTFTVDASVDGLRLEHSVPKELLGQAVDCYLSSQDLLTGLFFRAVLVESGNESVRLRFEEQDAKSNLILGTWLENLSRRSA